MCIISRTIGAQGQVYNIAVTRIFRSTAQGGMFKVDGMEHNNYKERMLKVEAGIG